MSKTALGWAMILMVAAAACSTDASSSTSTGNSATTNTAAAEPEASCPRDGEPLDTAKLYIEHNASDADTGVHGLFGGSAWHELCIWNPNGELIMVVDPRSALNELTVADLFFESREPPNDEYSIETLRAAFPEGQYMVGGTDFEGVARVGHAWFTHDIPARPTIVAPAVASDEETAGQALVGTQDLVVEWDQVTTTITGEPLDVTGYQIIITKVDHDDPNGWSRPVYDVHIGPGATSLSVPGDFLESGTVYELEILALEVSGNQTITVGFFKTR
ncbi:MAG: hypothetical protein OEM39_04660 [Acidimicrobiia bacterium]|nr:hypothetical protein [Acidimicrobiia bacterium]MDH3464267.1 hypothetical protein [Acidimicrobiia bacterium]